MKLAGTLVHARNKSCWGGSSKNPSKVLWSPGVEYLLLSESNLSFQRRADTFGAELDCASTLIFVPRTLRSRYGSVDPGSYQNSFLVKD